MNLDQEDKLLDCLQRAVKPEFHIRFIRLLRDDMKTRVWFVHEAQEISGPARAYSRRC